MRFATAAALLALAAAPVSASAQGVPNFTGTWVLQIDKSSFGEMPGPQRRTDVIDHREPNLTITRTSVGAVGETVTSLTLAIDGKPHKNTSGQFEVTSVLKWEGSTLVIANTVPNPQGGEITLTDRMTLSADGKTLTQVRVWSALGQGETTQTFVLVKQ